ncbi:MAG: TlpA disulfide reductase family protein [Dehalococcoidia bacterium]|nr:TlpA disulfide reductase family protein [Dehalococcoidia bacterium]
MATLPSFSLNDTTGATRTFPGTRPALLAFVKEDCPTCQMSMPLIEAAQQAFAEHLDVWSIGQDAEGNANQRAEQHGTTTGPMLDDSDLRVSFRYGIETVPTVILADANGQEQMRFEGFGRQDWQDSTAT